MSGFEWFFAVLSGVLLLSSFLVRILELHADEQRATVKIRRYQPYYRTDSSYR